MKRIAINLVVFLLLGAVVNVAVAWGCAAWPRVFHSPPNYREGFTRHGTGFNDWSVHTSRAAGFYRADSLWTTGSSEFIGSEPKSTAQQVLPAWAEFARPRSTDPADRYCIRIVDARGWPWLALWSGQEVVGFPPPGSTVGGSVTITRGYFLPREGAKPFSHYTGVRVLPLAPVLPGFLMNTLFYAVILWLLWSTPFATRRLIRKRRGRCVRCGYDLRHAEHEACPECGAA